MNFRSVLYAVVFMMFLCLPSISFSQEFDDLPDIPGDPDVPVPFDGGISLLVAAGIGYGVKKAYEKRNKTTADYSGGK
jgi:hypothetical protein